MTQADRLTSPSNALLKEVGKAAARGSMTADGYCIAETFHLLEEALRSNIAIKVVLASEASMVRARQVLRGRPEVRLVVVPETLMKRVSATEATQGVLTLVRPPVWTMQDMLQNSPLLVILDGLQDPGNVGAILRAAEAFRATGVVALKGSVSPYNPKSVRASAGSIFRIPVIHGVEGSEVRSFLGERGVSLFIATASGGEAAPEVELSKACAIVIGSEAHGPKPDLWQRVAALSVPTASVDSLNAAMAAGILLYEARRQRGILG